jgi:hypothetical protein
MQPISQLIVTILEVFPKDWGTVVNIHQTDNPHFVLVFEDKPWNWGARWAITQALSLFVRKVSLQLVCQDGAHGYIYTSPLRSYPVAEIREETALKFLQDLKISPGEYCSVINPDKTFFLCGVEDMQLYEKAGKLWKRMHLQSDQPTGLFQSKDQRKMNQFLELEMERALAIVRNLFQRMDKHNVSAAALVCCGNLPVHVCETLELRNISYAKIIPSEGATDKREDYVRLSQGGRSILEDLMSKLPGDIEWPADGDWENLRVVQKYDMETKVEQGAGVRELMPELVSILTSPNFRRLSVEEKRQVFQQFKNLSFSKLKEILPEAELEEILQADARYLGLEELLANPDFEEFTDFEEKIADLVTRVPDADLQKLQDSSIVTPTIKEALSRHFEKRETRYTKLVQQLSSPEFENDPEFDQKMTQIAARLNQEQFSDLIQSPTVIAKVKQELLKRILIPSLKDSIEVQVKKSAKPGVLGLGFLGLVCGVIGIVFGFAATVRWYPLLVTGLFFAETVYCFAVTRRRLAAGWLMFGLGFLGGFYIYGRWGMLIGLIVAFIATIVIRPDKDDEQMNNLRSLQNMLAGADGDHSGD